jgi:GalNAc-alpha-(1->4)-GalNAc-alpha-(1->3)-diNAcBac-PP-undecaprenol alpha-1,4-N-acetyl-D-galactosaminyltransferase
LLALYGTKYPVFISDRTSPDYKFSFPIPLMKRWLYPHSAGFIAQTQRAAEYKQKQFGDKLNIRVIPNAIREVKSFPDVKREKIILYVGRFAWEKGPERLIHAYCGLENRQGWKLLMAGSGPLLKPMQKW